jgi:hypothetical protein
LVSAPPEAVITAVSTETALFRWAQIEFQKAIVGGFVLPMPVNCWWHKDDVTGPYGLFLPGLFTRGHAEGAIKHADQQPAISMPLLVTEAVVYRRVMGLRLIPAQNEGGNAWGVAIQRCS